MSARTVSMAKSGTPSARSTSAVRAAAVSPTTRPSTRAAIAASSSGSRRTTLALRPPSSGRRASSSGRASTSTKIGARALASMDSRNASSPSSAYCASSMTSATALPFSLSRSRNAVQAENRSSRAKLPATPAPTRAARRGRSQSRSSSTGTYVRRAASRASATVSPVSASVSPRRGRSASASAQNATPSPYERQRPRCHRTVAASPSTYFSNSQTSRDLPTPGSPSSTTSRGRSDSCVEWNSSLTSAQLAVATDERRLEAVDALSRRRPRRRRCVPATTAPARPCPSAGARPRRCTRWPLR